VGPSGTEWDRVGPSGTEWDRVGPSKTEWDRVRPSGTEWDRVGPSGTEWDRVGPSGTEWRHVMLPILTLGMETNYLLFSEHPMHTSRIAGSSPCPRTSLDIVSIYVFRVLFAMETKLAKSKIPKQTR
jgi:hypothetical protein